MRARSRAVIASAGAALVVIPVSGVAAVALVGDDNAPADTVAAVSVPQSTDDASLVIVANSADTYTVEVPNVGVVVAAPRAASGAPSHARTVANSADVAQAIAGSAIVAEAAKYQGYKYTSGGKSPETGFDCSGFVHYVYAQFGYSLPTSSSGYRSVGTVVDSPLPGDIIYTPGHVGIYAGPNLQIDAPRVGKTIEFRAIWQTNPTYIRIS